MSSYIHVSNIAYVLDFRNVTVCMIVLLKVLNFLILCFITGGETTVRTNH